MAKKQIPYPLYDLTGSQSTMYTMLRYSIHKNVNQIPTSIVCSFPLDFDLLKRALNEEFRRNDCLRIRLYKDGDTVKQYFLPEYRKDDVPVLTFPVRKDDTDTMLAARHALEKGYRDITVCCALGGRFDHTLANLQTAAFIVSRGGRCRLLGRDTELIAFTRGTVRLPRRKGYKLGVFSLSDRCENVTLRGTDYECENIVLSSAFPLGACNAWAADTAEISVGNGILLAVSSREAEEH